MATAYVAPEYSRPIEKNALGPTSLMMIPYGGDIEAKMTVVNDTMLIGQVPSLARIVDGWFADEAIDTNATATTTLKLEVTDGTLTYVLMATRAADDLGVQTFTRLSEITNALGHQLPNTNKNQWDVKVSAPAVAATAGTAGILKVFLLYETESYGA